ncbi:MAG: NAD(P)H-hydrate dehydratase [Lachnospiraceae bacterium]|nr:NAD(P)H-hydrate dehydratase [Lachnospiraceae bacterium]
MQIATKDQMRGMDRTAIEDWGISSTYLMERAAKGFARAAAELCDGVRWSERAENGNSGSGEEKGDEAKRVAVFCGPGNNGGDGVAAARFLLEQGFLVRTFLVGRRERMTPDCREMEKRLIALGGVLEDFVPEEQGQEGWCQEADVILDAIFGIGLHGAVQGAARTAIRWINESPAPVVSADIASGVEADTGRILGTAVQATVTVTFTCPKAGHFVGKGALYAGRVLVHEIGIPEEVREKWLHLPLQDKAEQTQLRDWTGAWENPATLETLTLAEVGRLLPERPKDGHKGTFGKVYVLGGSVGLSGAPLFASQAAVRSGSGLVFVGVPGQIYGIVAGASQEAMPYPLACDQEGRLIMESLWSISNRAEHCDAVLMGPGMGRSRDVERLVGKLLLRLRQPLVLDADGLYAIRNRRELLKERASRGWVTVLTPHDGEFAYLGGDLSGQQRLMEARRFAREYGCILVLKGHGTLIAEPGGRTFVNTTGNCGMAKGGSGDVLSGMILSFLGQGVKPLLAAALGVWMHGRAGDLCAQEKTVYAMSPRDMVESLPGVFRELLGQRRSRKEKSPFIL